MSFPPFQKGFQRIRLQDCLIQRLFLKIRLVQFAHQRILSLSEKSKQIPHWRQFLWISGEQVSWYVIYSWRAGRHLTPEVCTSKEKYCIVSLISLDQANCSRPLACGVIQCAPGIVTINPLRLDVIRIKKCFLYLPVPGDIGITHIWRHWVLHHLPCYITDLKYLLLIVVSDINILFFTNTIKT